LSDIGWTNLIPRCDLCLPLTDLVPLSTIRRAASWPDDEPYPLVQLELTISKRYCDVSVFTIMYNQVDLRRYVHARRELLEEIAAPDACDLTGSGTISLYRRPGGWADDVDWSTVSAAIADRSSRWREAFEDLCQECRAVLDQWAVADKDSGTSDDLGPSAAQVLEQAGPEGMRAALRSAGISLDALQRETIANNARRTLESDGFRLGSRSRRVTVARQHMLGVAAVLPQALGCEWGTKRFVLGLV
jgi:hypothetical protein